MTRGSKRQLCQVDLLHVDPLPCMFKARHFVKILSTEIGEQGKIKVWLCPKHYEIVKDGILVKELIEQYAKEGRDFF